MLSILIPVYNYNVFPLVLELQKQCLECNLKFEIICQDDASNAFVVENQAINNLENCYFSFNEINLGRGRNRNYLASKAKFPWLLFLDCDTFPRDSNFIKKYLFEIEKKNQQAIFGGIIYNEDKPKKEQLLRWTYGHKRESLSVEKRKKNPNIRALTSNLLLKKELFLQFPFDESIKKYGYEDLCFLIALKKNQIIVSHLENPTFHLNLETSKLFLDKTKMALDNLLLLHNSNKITKEASKIIKMYSSQKELKTISIIVYFFNTFENEITINLLSKKPSLLLFDIYKLGYYCKIQSK